MTWYGTQAQIGKFISHELILRTLYFSITNETTTHYPVLNFTSLAFNDVHEPLRHRIIQFVGSRNRIIVPSLMYCFLQLFFASKLLVVLVHRASKYFP